MLSTAGAVVLGAGFVLFLWDVVYSRWYGAPAGDNPWGAETLEWAASSPPPAYNFRFLPTVRSREVLWEDPPDTPVVDGLAEDQREVLVTTFHDAAPSHRYNMALDSPWPFLAALVLFATLVGLLFHPWALPIGTAAFTVAMLGWFWPTHEPKPIHHPRTDPPAGGGATP